MTKYHVDQRVRVYATLCGTVAETKGTVKGIREDGMLRIYLDTDKVIVAHPKQCRRLKTPARVQYKGTWEERDCSIVFVPHFSYTELKRRHFGKRMTLRQVGEAT